MTEKACGSHSHSLVALGVLGTLCVLSSSFPLGIFASVGLLSLTWRGDELLAKLEAPQMENL